MQIAYTFFYLPENTTGFRKSLCEKIGISENSKENTSFGNFSLWIIDWMMEFPIIVELYLNNAWFRDAFWIELKNIGISDFTEAIVNIWKWFSEWTAYEKWKSSVKSLLLFTWIGGILRWFWVILMRKWSNVILTKIWIWAVASWIHWTWYALSERWELTIKSKIHYIIQ